MSSTTLLRRTATVLITTAIAVPSFAGVGGSAWAQPAQHGKSAATRDAGSADHGHRHHARTAKPAAHGHAGASSHAARHFAAPAAKHSRDAASAPAAKTHAAGGDDPSGNNGTVFIHDVAGDSRPHNVPHVGCTFYVDFFGFDSGQVLTTSFVGQAPTGAGTALPTGDWTGTMPANGASGAGRDFDAEQAFTLDTSVLGAPQAQQGYHVKLTVATGEPGGVKHKVFWVSACAQPTVAAVAAHESLRAPTVAGVRVDRVAPQVLGLTVARTLSAGGTRVAAASATRTPMSLPFTGAAVGLLLAVAGVVLAAGGALVIAGRRTRCD